MTKYFRVYSKLSELHFDVLLSSNHGVTDLNMHGTRIWECNISKKLRKHWCICMVLCIKSIEDGLKIHYTKQPIKIMPSIFPQKKLWWLSLKNVLEPYCKPSTIAIIFKLKYTRLGKSHFFVNSEILRIQIWRKQTHTLRQIWNRDKTV